MSVATAARQASVATWRLTEELQQVVRTGRKRATRVVVFVIARPSVWQQWQAAARDPRSGLFVLSPTDPRLQLFTAVAGDSRLASFQFRGTGLLGFDRATGGFDRTTGGSDRATGVDLAIQRVEMRIADLISLAHTGS